MDNGFANAAEESAYAKRMLARADQMLASIDEVFIIKERGHQFRAMPTFRHEEISLGATLGTGGFGIVNEITKFTLDDEQPQEDPHHPTNNTGETDGEKEVEHCEKENVVGGQHAVTVKSNVDNVDRLAVSNNVQDKKESMDATTVTTVATGTTLTDESKFGAAAAAAAAAAVQAQSPAATAAAAAGIDAADLLALHNSHTNPSVDEFHYDVEKARGLMSLRVTKNGYARYALKRLHNDLTELERARGMIDLAVEAKYLSLVWHPNISTYIEHAPFVISC
jgi:hypothetical protein